jgi:hypothetical protein
MPRQQYREAKLKELILYVSAKSETDPKYGYTKLNKLLFYIDFSAFREFGEAVTGARYHAIEHGPAPMAMKHIERDMTEARDLVIRPGFRGGLSQQKPIALRGADLGAFSGREIALVDDVIGRFWNLDATEIQHLSHEEIGWRLAYPRREEIPYSVALIESIEITAPR